MTDEPPKVLHAVTTAKDEMAGNFEAIKRLWEGQRANAREIAQTRRALYLAYVKVGFTEAQALELCKSLAL